MQRSERSNARGSRNSYGMCQHRNRNLVSVADVSDDTARRAADDHPTRRDAHAPVWRAAAKLAFRLMECPEVLEYGCVMDALAHITRQLSALEDLQDR